MATPTKQARTTHHRDQRSLDGKPSEFLVFQSNSGDYRWEIVSRSGVVLAQSGSFESFDDAEQAADRVRDGAGSTRLATRTAGPGRRGAAFVGTAPTRGR